MIVRILTAPETIILYIVVATLFAWKWSEDL